MVRDKKRFRCRYQKFTDHRNVESIPAEELEGIVWKAVDIQLRLLEEKEAVFRREKELCEEKRRKLLPEMKKKKMQAEKKREEIRQLYHQYRQGKMGKAEYLARKKWEGNLAGEMEEELAGMEAEEKGLHQRMKETDADNVALTEWLELKEDKKGFLQCVIDSIDVYAEKAIEIKWKHRDSFTGTLTEKL